jgi:hypothetical protein
VNINENGDPIDSKNVAAHNREFSVDIDTLETRSFDVGVRTMEIAAVEPKSPAGGSSVVVAALADALAKSKHPLFSRAAE